MPHRVLNEDWSDYDNKKKKGVDARDFSCEEDWEVDYLVAKIKKHLSKTEVEIRDAIAQCCKSIKPPRPRQEFVKCVFNRLDPKDPKDPPKPPKPREVG
jgi:hypothetical protein